MQWTRRQFISHVGVVAVAAALPFERATAQTRSGVNSRDRVIICNEIPIHCRSLIPTPTLSRPQLT
jgi:hypothetical protein